MSAARSRRTVTPETRIDPLMEAQRLLAEISVEGVRTRLQRALVLWDLGYAREALTQFRLTAEDALGRLLDGIDRTEAGLRRELLERGQAGKVIQWLHREAEIIPARVALHLHTLLAWGNYASHHQSGGHHAQSSDLALLLRVSVDLEAWLAAREEGASIFSDETLARELEALGTKLDPKLVSRVAKSAGGDVHLARCGLRIPHLSWELFAERPARRVRELPFRGLHVFDLEDADQFWGRDEACAALAETVAAQPLTLLSGVSGVGKTSLIRAGLLPILLEKGHGALAMGDYSAAGLRATLQVVGAWNPERMLTIVFDQVEQILLPEAPTDVQRGLLELMLRAVKWRRSVRMVAVVREDYLGRLLREIRHIAGETSFELERSLMMLGPLAPQDLRQALVGPLGEEGPRFSDELVDEVLVPALGESTPAQLQLVCSHLYERAVADEREIIDVAFYVRLGGAEQILERHLDATLSSYGDERFLAETLLKAMAGARTRRWVELGVLWQAATAASIRFVDELRLVGVLDRMAGDRLVTSRARRDVGVVEYSLVHDQLTVAVTERRSAVELEQQQAREILERASSEWGDQDWREPLSGRQLKLVERHASALALDGDAFSVLAASRRARFARRSLFVVLLALALVGTVFGGWQLRRALSERARAMRAADRGVLLQARIALERDPSVAVALLRHLSARASGIGVLSVVEEARRRGVARVLDAHRAPVSAVVFASRSGVESIITAGHDRSLRRWSLGAKERGDPLRGHAAPITSLAVSADGRHAVSGDTAGHVRLWSLATGETLVQRSAHGDWVYAASFSPTKGRFATAGLDGKIVLWSAKGRVLREIAAHRQGVLALAFSPDGRSMASAGQSGRIRLWRTDDGAPLTVLKGHRRAVVALLFTPRGGRLISGGLDTTIRYWDAGVGRPLGVPSTHHAEAVTALALSADGETLASAGEDKTIRLWSVASRREVGEPLRGHLAFIRSLAFSARGRILASASEDHTARLWDLGARRAKALVLKDHPRGVHALAISSDGARLASGGRGGEVALWDLAARKRSRVFTAHDDAVVALAFDAEGSRLASGGYDRIARVWHLAPPRGKAPTATSRSTTLPSSPASSRLFVGRGPVYALAYAPRGRGLILGGTDALRLFERGHVGEPLLGHEDAVSALAYSPDGSRFVSASHDHTLRLWDTDKRQQIGLPVECPARIDAVAFSPRGRWIVAAGADGVLHLFDANRWGRTRRALRHHQHAVYAVAFSARGELLASAGAGGVIRLWKVGREVEPMGAPLLGHSGAVYALAFTPDGKLLASGSADGTVRLWPIRPASSRQLRREIDRLTNIRVDPEGRVQRDSR